MHLEPPAPDTQSTFVERLYDCSQSTLLEQSAYVYYLPRNESYQVFSSSPLSASIPEVPRGQ